MSSQRETRQPEERAQKRDADDAKLDEVHSANNWEKANLGDDERHQKFLRLMGAGRKEHKGRFVIGDKDARTDRTQETSSLIERKLECQYNEGMDLKLSGAARHHTGLGFREEPPKEEPPKPAPKAEPVPNEESAPKVELAITEEPAPKETKEEPVTKAPPAEKPTEGGENSNSAKSQAGQTNGGDKEADTSSENSEKFQMNFVKASS